MGGGAARAKQRVDLNVGQADRLRCVRCAWAGRRARPRQPGRPSRAPIGTARRASSRRLTVAGRRPAATMSGGSVSSYSASPSMAKALSCTVRCQAESGADRSGSRAGLPREVVARQAGEEGRHPPARPGHPPPLYVLYAKSPPALDPRLLRAIAEPNHDIACNISVRSHCTQQTASP